MHSRRCWWDSDSILCKLFTWFHAGNYHWDCSVRRIPNRYRHISCSWQAGASKTANRIIWTRWTDGNVGTSAKMLGPQSINSTNCILGFGRGRLDELTWFCYGLMFLFGFSWNHFSPSNYFPWRHTSICSFRPCYPRSVAYPSSRLHTRVVILLHDV